MRHFYKKMLSSLIFWLLFSQSLSLFDTAAAAEQSGDLEEEGSEGRSLGDLFGLVKQQLTGPSVEDVETGRSSSGIWNTTLAFTVPLFSFTLPDKAAAGKDYTKQAALSLLGLAMVGGLAVIPYVWAATKATGRKRRSENDVPANVGLVGMLVDFASKSGFDVDTCVQRSVCEANRTPDKYGYLVLPVRFLTMQQSRSTQPSPYLKAADFGAKDSSDCSARYRCAFSMIDAARFLVSYIYPPSKST